MQASISCVLGLVTKTIWRPDLQLSINEWLKDHKVGMFETKSNSQRLKKSKKFTFGNSPITRQHNMSLNGTRSKI